MAEKLPSRYAMCHPERSEGSGSAVPELSTVDPSLRWG
jgi:hypothetical protein